MIHFPPPLTWAPRSVGGVPQGWSDQPSLWYPLDCIILPGGNVVQFGSLIQSRGHSTRSLTFFVLFIITVFRFCFQLRPYLHLRAARKVIVL